MQTMVVADSSNTQGVCVQDGGTPEERLDKDECFIRDKSMWESESKAGIKELTSGSNIRKVENQFSQPSRDKWKPSLWGKTVDDPGFAAIETLKYPIALINMMKKNPCTGAVAGICFGTIEVCKTIGMDFIYHPGWQQPKSGKAVSIGDYKQENSGIQRGNNMLIEWDVCLHLDQL